MRVTGYDTNTETDQSALRSATIQRIGSRDFLDVAGEPAFTLAIEYSGGNAIYVGEAAPGTSKSEGAWRIKKITYDSNNNATDVQWANGDDKWDKIWDNRASYSYS